MRSLGCGGRGRRDRAHLWRFRYVRERLAWVAREPYLAVSVSQQIG